MRLGGSEVLEVLLLLVEQPHLELHRAGEVVLLADLDLGCDHRNGGDNVGVTETNSMRQETCVATAAKRYSEVTMRMTDEPMREKRCASPQLLQSCEQRIASEG